MTNIHSTLLKKFIYPIIHSRKSSDESWLKCLQTLEKTQWWTPQQLEELQQKKLRMLTKYAYNNVPYYHRIFKERNLKPDDIKSVDDLIKLPILTKKDIRNNLIDLVAINRKPNAIPYATGGTTGEPLNFYVDKKMLTWGSAASYRSNRWAGFEVGDKHVILWGHFGDIEIHKKLLTRFNDILRREKMLPCFDMTNETMTEYIEFLRKFKPKIIKGYSSAVYLLAKFMEHAGISDVKPIALVTTAEKLFKHQRELIESQFGCEVFDSYGCREASVIASECQEHSGYHISVENVVLEFRNENEHVANGELGGLLITNLNNYVMPFIRYEVGDAGIPSEEICSCGRNLPLVKSLEGRIHDIITTPSGRYLPGEFFPAIFADYEIKGIQQYQIIQKRKDKLLFKIVKGANFMDEELETVVNVIRQHTGDGMEIEVKVVDLIPLSKSGKRKFTVSEVPLKFV